MTFADAYPHLWDAIFSAASYPSLLRLRATSKAVRDQVDARLCSHLAVRLPGGEVRAIMDDELVRLPADWRTHAKAVHTLSLVPSVRTVSLPNAADLICSFTPTSGDVRWTMERISMGEALDRLEALSGFSAWNAAGHRAAWASQDCWCGARRGVPIPLLAGMAALVKVKTIRSWGMHVCAIPIIAERIVFHSLLSDGPYSPPTTLVATISTTGDNPGVRPWSPLGTVTNAAIHITGPHPRRDITWAIGSLMPALVAPLLRRGVDVSLDYERGMRGAGTGCPPEAFCDGLAKWLRWNGRLVDTHLGFESGEVEKWCTGPEWPVDYSGVHLMSDPVVTGPAFI